MVERKTFVEYDRKYFVFQDESETAYANNCSCIIIEDEPGAYRRFAKKLVEDGMCRLAAVLPFSEQSLRLLNGAEAIFGSDVTLQIPTLTRCVAILDMRNESPSTFEGEEDKAMAGADFQRRLNKRVVSFFATGYGSARFKETGLNGIYGFVDVSRKSGATSADLSEKDHATLLSAVALGLNDLCFRTQNSVVVSKKLAIFSFRGWDIAVTLDKPMKALIQVLKAGQDGVHPNVLMKLINSKSFAPDALPAMADQRLSHEDLGEGGSMHTSATTEVKDIYGREDLIRFQKLVSAHYHWTQDVMVAEQELIKDGIKQEFIKEICRQVKALRDANQGKFDWEDFRELLHGAFKVKYDRWSEEELDQRTEKVCSYIKLIESEFAEVEEKDLKKYKNLLYKWRLLKCPNKLVIGGEPKYMSNVRKSIYRALKAIKDSPLAPDEFYRHLRDSIVIDSDAVRYIDGEEWPFG